MHGRGDVPKILWQENLYLLSDSFETKCLGRFVGTATAVLSKQSSSSTLHQSDYVPPVCQTGNAERDGNQRCN